MCHSVVVEVAAGCEALATDAALVRLLPAMNTSVRVETRAGRESLLADITNMGPLTGVGPQVPVEQ